MEFARSVIILEVIKNQAYFILKNYAQMGKDNKTEAKNSFLQTSSNLLM
jgi:hypothetical protein